jgi:hypothetical protein
MSSVTRFIRQVPVSTTYYNAATVFANPTNMVFELVPDSGNYVGNYPPGYMATASAALQAAIAQAANANAAGAGLTLRDMGKTVYAAATSAAAPGTDPRNTPSTVAYGYFRQVQLIAPKAIGFGTGNQIIGGTSGSNFGVLGAQNTPDIYTDFLTFYIPVTVAGVLQTAVNTQAFAIAGGQM